MGAFNVTIANAAPAFTNPATGFFGGLNTMAIVVGIKASVFAPMSGSSANAAAEVGNTESACSFLQRSLETGARPPELTELQ